MKKGSSPGLRTQGGDWEPLCLPRVCSQNQARFAWLHVMAHSVPHAARPLGTAGDWSDGPLLLAVSSPVAPAAL